MENRKIQDTYCWRAFLDLPEWDCRSDIFAQLLQGVSDLPWLCVERECVCVCTSEQRKHDKGLIYIHHHSNCISPIHVQVHTHTHILTTFVACVCERERERERKRKEAGRRQSEQEHTNGTETAMAYHQHGKQQCARYLLAASASATRFRSSAVSVPSKIASFDAWRRRCFSVPVCVCERERESMCEITYTQE